MQWTCIPLKVVPHFQESYLYGIIEKNCPQVTETWCGVEQEIFMLAVGLLQRMCADPERAARAGQDSASIRQMQAVAQLLTRKVDNEQKYLERLEGDEPLSFCVAGGFKTRGVQIGQSISQVKERAIYTCIDPSCACARAHIYTCAPLTTALAHAQKQEGRAVKWSACVRGGETRQAVHDGCSASIALWTRA
jgi:hypothetical protein